LEGNLGHQLVRGHGREALVHHLGPVIPFMAVFIPPLVVITWPGQTHDPI
jgi:hypothetical protein